MPGEPDVSPDGGPIRWRQGEIFFQVRNRVSCVIIVAAERGVIPSKGVTIKGSEGFISFMYSCPGRRDRILVQHTSCGPNDVLALAPEAF